MGIKKIGCRGQRQWIMKQSVRTILSQYCVKIFRPKLRIGSSLSSLKGNSASLELFSLHEHDQHFFSFILVHVRRDAAIEQEKIDLFKSFERRMNDSIQSWFASLNDIRKVWEMCIFTPGPWAVFLQVVTRLEADTVYSGHISFQ